MEENATVFYQAEQNSDNSPSLIVIEKQSDRVYTLDVSNHMLIGRKNKKTSPDIIFDSEIVSRKHGLLYFDYEKRAYYYKDYNSLNGTFVNGVKLEKKDDKETRSVKLHDGDILRIDRSDMNKPHSQAVMMIFSTIFSKDDIFKRIPTFDKFEFKIGRQEELDVVIDNCMVSRLHAIMKKDENEQWTIYDNDSMNGVIVNNVRIDGFRQLNNYDVVRIADTVIIIDDDEIIFNVTKLKGESLNIDIKDKTVFQSFRRKTLIKDIKLTINSGEMVLVLGGSGAGKTTFMNAVLGIKKANGKIELGGQDLYKNYESLKYKIGFVPQFSLVRKNDDVFHAIYDSAKMKLPRDTEEAELREKVYEVMEMLGISELEHNLCGNISGGQLKRVSVAVEAIANPSVFFLDEPDSGLDAGSNRSLMENLKEISNTNKIVMVITHSPNIAQDLFDKIFVIAKSSKQVGQVAFFGTVSEAKEFFLVDSLQEIVIEINSTSEGGKGRADEFIEKYKRLRERN